MKYLLIVIVAGILFAAYSINKHLPKGRAIAGKHEERLHENVLYLRYHQRSAPENLRKEVLQAILDHELIHNFKAQGLIEIDIPYAAVMGYYTEWKLTDSLHEADRFREFTEGMKSGFSTTEIQRLVEPYMRFDAVEDAQSYLVGARVAGIIAAKFGKDHHLEAAQFLFCLGMGLGPNFAEAALNDKKLLALLIDYRRGEFVTIDYEAMDARVKELSASSALNAKRYLDSRNSDSKFILIKNKRNVISPFEDELIGK